MARTPAAKSFFVNELNARLPLFEGWLKHHVAKMASMNGGAGIAVDAGKDLLLREAKRVRPVIFFRTLEGMGGKADGRAMDVGVALELLQGYLLIHDDWMDKSKKRRNGDTVHVMLGKSYSGIIRKKSKAEEIGASMAILAGDYLEAQALHAIMNAGYPPAQTAKAGAAYTARVRDVILGQMLDMHLEAQGFGTTEAVLRVHYLKTACYTTVLPMELGRILSPSPGRSPRAIQAYAEAAGVAFQVKDDVFGTWGDPAKTKKPGAIDLVEGKINYPVAWAMEHSDIFKKRRYPAEGDGSALAKELEREGALEATLKECARHERKAKAVVGRLPFDSESKRFFDGMLDWLSERDH